MKRAMPWVVAVLVAASLFVAMGRAPAVAVAMAPTADAAMAETPRSLFERVFMPAGADAPVFVTGLENLPRSLEGTDVDGALEADADGHLKITNAVRRTFDYFLSALGEEPLDTIVARLRAYIRAQLPATAAAEAEQLLADYLAYRQALADVDAATAPSADGQLDLEVIRARMAQVADLRAQFLSPEEAGAFYADEDRMDRYMLERVAILQQQDMDAAVRAGQLAALEQQLPAHLRETSHVFTQYQNLEALTADWRRDNGTPGELRQIRENLLGPEAADRLQALGHERAVWDRRMEDWLRERAGILAASGLGEADRQRQLDALRTSRFSEAEVLRVHGLERLADGTAPP